MGSPVATRPLRKVSKADSADTCEQLEQLPNIGPALAEARGMVQLKGHRLVDGMRASIYNAMPMEGVQALVAYLKEFEAGKG